LDHEPVCQGEGAVEPFVHWGLPALARLQWGSARQTRTTLRSPRLLHPCQLLTRKRIQTSLIIYSAIARRVPASQRANQDVIRVQLHAHALEKPLNVYDLSLEHVERISSTVHAATSKLTCVQIFKPKTSCSSSPRIASIAQTIVPGASVWPAANLPQSRHGTNALPEISLQPDCSSSMQQHSKACATASRLK
jgi:hypothetical protein